MQVNVGDLVTCRTKGTKIGIVVDRKLSCSGLMTSEHVKHMLNIYPHVYYVYFAEEGKTGPHHETEVLLQQSLDQR
jgi:hypothetical protein